MAEGASCLVPALSASCLVFCPVLSCPVLSCPFVPLSFSLRSGLEPHHTRMYEHRVIYCQCSARGEDETWCFRFSVVSVCMCRTYMDAWWGI